MRSSQTPGTWAASLPVPTRNRRRATGCDALPSRCSKAPAPQLIRTCRDLGELERGRVHLIVTASRDRAPNISLVRFAEIHFHLLPGVDDGPQSLEESVELARMAAAETTGTIVATPHVNSHFPTDISSLPERVRELTDRLRRKRVELEVHCGAELGLEMVGRLSQAELEAIAHGPPRNRWLLLEAPLAGLDDRFSAAADELRDRGFAAVIAHPERALGVPQSSWRVLERELQAGSALQLNAWSLAGLNGEHARTYALRLLHAVPLVAVASDAHGPARAPALRLALDALARLGERTPRRFVTAVPHALLERGLPARSPAIAA